MQKIGDITNTADSHGEFTNGNVAAGIPPTILEAAWYNTVQREMINVLLKAGMKPDKTNDAQLSEAIGRLIVNSQTTLTNSFGMSNVLGASQKLATEANNNANSRLEKAKNGADILNKNEFVKNLGLAKTVEQAENSLPRESGWTFTSGAHVIQGSRDYATLTLAKSDGYKISIQTQPHNASDMLVFSYGDQSIYVPKKSGTLATLNDITSKISELPKNTALNPAARDGWWQCGDTGLIYQYGYYAGQYEDNTVRFPMRFFNKCHIVVITSVSDHTGSWDRTARVRDFPTRESFQYWAGSAQFNIFWWAVGY
ncbi:gp53-like domain-containing protein [Xenorhabdus szentirmaii]|nr:hypothetical protein [Xenorhabdus sp. 38]MBD2781636.1 hypothetical protein [Xenorhabdus sp. 38]